MYRNLLVALPAVVVALGISSLVASRAFSEEDGRNVSNADRGSERPARASRESCWHPGMSRNIGIAERACDPLTPKNAAGIERVRVPGSDIKAEQLTDGWTPRLCPLWCKSQFAKAKREPSADASQA